MTPRLLRSVAVLIAILGVVDPSVVLTRPVPSTISVIDTTGATGAADGLAERVAQSLGSAFTVVRQPVAGAVAVVVVGDRPPSGVVSTDETPVFSVVREPAAHAVVIANLVAPRRAPLDARVAITATIHASGTRGHQIEVTLAAGDLVVDKVVHDVTVEDDRFDVPLMLVPATEGLTPLRVTAREVDPMASSAIADAAIDIRRQPWAVLVYDSHPSWASTFVRRALEHDVRFAVTARMDTSQDASTSLGQPPASLASLDALLPYDAIVVGAPDDLTSGDVSGLQAFARRRAGAIVLILDKAPSAKLESLVGRSHWTDSTNASALAVNASAPIPVRLMSSEFVWPDSLPSGAEAIATVTAGNATRPVIWRMPLGAGRIVVSGALDAWRARAAAASAFDEYWRTVVAEAADGSPPPLDATIEPATGVPGELAVLRVTMRDVALGSASADPARPLQATIDAHLEGAGGSTPLRLWPDDEPGGWRGVTRTPGAGAYRIVVTSGTLTATTPWRIQASVAKASEDGAELLRAWTASRGGSSVPASRATEIREVVQRAIHVPSAPQTWRPLRSPWWIMPFALLLGGEWWWRRRRGLP